MKKTLNISFTVLLFAGLAALISLTSSKHKEYPCKEVIITLDSTGQNDLLSEKEISKLVFMDINDLAGKPCTDICIETISENISSNAFVEDCDVCLTVNGVLRVNVKQKRPIARIFNEYGDPYLMDASGNLLPPKNTALDLQVVSGYINYRFSFSDTPYYTIDPEKDPLLMGIYELVIQIRSDALLSSLIDQIYITREGETELIPKLGHQVIQFGSFERMEEKLIDLKDTYISVLPAKGWDVYKTINLKYENQIICSK